MANRFKLVTKEYVNPGDYPIGIRKDATITGVEPDNNHGRGFSIEGLMNLGVASKGGIEGGRNYWHIVLEIQMPEKGDVPGMELVQNVEIKFKMASNNIDSGKYVVIGITEIQDDFDEGNEVGAPGWCNWTEYIDSIEWSRGDGAVKSRNSVDDEDKPVFDTLRVSSSTSGWLIFNLTEALDFGDLKRFVLFVANSDISSGSYATDVGTFILFSKETGTEANRPILSVTYRDYPPDAFTEDDALVIEPNQDNPEQPVLKWGGVDADDFTKFKLYRATAPITSVTSLTPIFETDSPTDQEYVDDDITLSDGTTYYYLVIAEDTQNTGNDATFSKNVSFTKPKVNSATLSPTGSQTVGVLATLSVTGNVPIKKMYVDWKDGTKSWYEFETAQLTQEVTHLYLSHTGGSVNPDVRIEDTNRPTDKGKGFWSSLTTITDAIDVDDTTPLAKLRTNAQKSLPYSWVSLDATLSQPASSDATITNYKFKRYSGDAWQDNGSDPIYEFQLSGPPWNGSIISVSDEAGDIVRVNTTTNPLLNIGDTVIIDGAGEYDGIHTVVSVGPAYFEIEHKYFGTATGTWANLTTQTAELEITTSTGKTATTTVTYTLGHQIPVDINFSPDTNISEIPRTLGINKDIQTPIGSQGSEIEYVLSRPAERVEIVADITSPHIEWDADKIRRVRDDNRLIRISFKNEYETKVVEYTGTIEGDVRISTIQENRARLSFTILVYTRTETYIPSKGGVITSITDDAEGNCLIFTDHEGLNVGDEVRLLNMGNKDYEGVYLILGVSDTFFVINCPYSGNDTGEWRKAVYTMGEV